MAEAELRKLGRRELLEILKDREDEIERLNRVLVDVERKLADRTIHIERAGSIAEAALAVSGIFERAQEAASQYLENIERLSENQQRICEEAENKSKRDAEVILEDARERAAGILRAAHDEADKLLQNAQAAEEDTKKRCEQMISDAKKEADTYRDKITKQVEEYCQAREELRELLTAGTLPED